MVGKASMFQQLHHKWHESSQENLHEVSAAKISARSLLQKKGKLFIPTKPISRNLKLETEKKFNEREKEEGVTHMSDNR